MELYDLAAPNPFASPEGEAKLTDLFMDRPLANNVLSLIRPEPGGWIDPEPGGVRRPPIIDQWESMPAMTRVKVEAMVKAIPSRSLVRWLDDVAGLLVHRFRETHHMGRIPIFRRGF